MRIHFVTGEKEGGKRGDLENGGWTLRLEIGGITMGKLEGGGTFLFLEEWLATPRPG